MVYFTQKEAQAGILSYSPKPAPLHLWIWKGKVSANSNTLLKDGY